MLLGRRVIPNMAWKTISGKLAVKVGGEDKEVF